jgi:hypothetical protein
VGSFGAVPWVVRARVLMLRVFCLCVMVLSAEEHAAACEVVEVENGESPPAPNAERGACFARPQLDEGVRWPPVVGREARARTRLRLIRTALVLGSGG